MKTLSKKTKQKKKKRKTASDSDELSVFLNELVEVQFKEPLLDTNLGIPMGGMTGVLLKVTKDKLYLGDKGEITSIIDKNIVVLINKASSVHPGLLGMPIPEDPSKAH